MARQTIHGAVADALREMGVEKVIVDLTRRHPRVLWEDRDQRGIITVPGTASDRRSMVNNVTMARRIIRQARGG